jgi:hypothetical protein
MRAKDENLFKEKAALFLHPLRYPRFYELLDGP